MSNSAFQEDAFQFDAFQTGYELTLEPAVGDTKVFDENTFDGGVFEESLVAGAYIVLPLILSAQRACLLNSGSLAEAILPNIAVVERKALCSGIGYIDTILEETIKKNSLCLLFSSDCLYDIYSLNPEIPWNRKQYNTGTEWSEFLSPNILDGCVFDKNVFLTSSCWEEPERTTGTMWENFAWV